jgi:hypothetical protein
MQIGRIAANPVKLSRNGSISFRASRASCLTMNTFFINYRTGFTACAEFP